MSTALISRTTVPPRTAGKWSPMPDPHAAWDALRISWGRFLRARNLAPKALALYDNAARLLIERLTAKQPRLLPGQVRGEHVEVFLADLQRRPRAGDRLPGVPGAAAVVRLDGRAGRAHRRPDHPDACSGPPGAAGAGAHRRAAAGAAWLLRGPAPGRPSRHGAVPAADRHRWPARRGVRLAVDDSDVDRQVCRVAGKGRRERVLPFGAKTTEALDRYLRARAADKHASAPGLWLDERAKGPLTSNGVYQVVKRRGRLVGLEGLHPHQFRHTASHRWLAEGGSETDRMQRNGWKSCSMLSRYAASAAAERARDAHRRMGLGDRL